MCSMHIKTDEEQQANEFVRLVRGFDGTVLDLWVTWAAFDVGVVDALLFSVMVWLVTFS